MIAERFHSADDVRDSIESLYQAHGTRRPVIYWLLLGIVAAGVASLPLIKVDISVGAGGQVRPEVERLMVVSAVEGHIKSLSVADNQPVHRGDTLLALETDAIDARIEQLHRVQSTNRDETADLALLIARTGPALEAPSASAADHFLTLTSPEFVTTLPRALRSAQYVRQHAVLVADVQRLLLQRERARRELERSGALHAKGLIADIDYDQQRFAAASVDREIELTVQQTLARWQAEKIDHEAKADELEAQAHQFAEQRDRYVVRAPVDGTALGFSGLQTGLFLPAAQRLGEISPGGGLQADVYLSPRDVGFVYPGQRVSIQVDAFPYTEWGTLKGRVHDVSQDFVQVGQQPAFRAVIDLDDTELRSGSGVRVSIRRGMTVNARFVVKRQSLFHVLYGKMSDSFDPHARPSGA